nr:hypothetical protein [uncultured Halomonas sp.]
MWFIQPKKDYVAEMPWKHLDEPAVMSWQIRVRDYDTGIANNTFFLIAISIVLFFYFVLFYGGEKEKIELDAFAKTFIVLYFFLLLIAMSMTHQTTIIVYRLTEKGCEIFSWKPQIDSVKPVMKWTAIISAVAVVVLVLVDPSFSIALVGPAGFGLLALMMGNSKSYQSLARDSSYEEMAWKDVEEIAVYKKRRLIGLLMTYKNDEGAPYSVYGKIYCHKENLDKCVNFLKSATPQVPYVERKLNVYANFAT